MKAQGTKTSNISSVELPAAKSKRVGVKCDFKPKASDRTLRFATDEEAKAAGKWAIKKYHETFRELAK
jgi:hypothetical protein